VPLVPLVPLELDELLLGPGPLVPLVPLVPDDPPPGPLGSVGGGGPDDWFDPGAPTVVPVVGQGAGAGAEPPRKGSLPLVDPPELDVDVADFTFQVHPFTS
jgi:hypothetical protein